MIELPTLIVSLVVMGFLAGYARAMVSYRRRTHRWY
jgi:hypothetical protein